MNQHSRTPGRPEARAPIFFWITLALLALLLLGGAAGVLWLAFEAKSINRSGGWGWLLVGAIYMVAIFIGCFACALCTVVSLFRRETHRRLSIVILVVSSLVTSVLGANLIRAAIGRHRQHDEVARVPEGTPQPPGNALSRSSISPASHRSSTAPVLRQGENQQIFELKSNIWQAIRTKNADAFVDCFFIEERFNTLEIRQENRNQIEILLKGETTDVEVREIPTNEMVEIMRIQNAKANSLFRYSLVPRMILRIRQEALNGNAGRSFLIGEQNGKWHIITMAGHTT